MLEPQDIQKLMEVLATKEDIRELKDRVSALEESQKQIITILDKMSARLEMLHQEYLVLKERDSRYERWFHEIAQKVGITLTP